MTIVRSDWQKTVWNDNHRYLVINCGRRAGKSTIASLRMLWFASENDKSIVWYVAPTYKQAKSIMWTMLKELVPVEAISKLNETELKITLINGSEILLKGADNPDSLRGVRIDFCIFDEAAFIDKWDEVWKVMRPTLMDSKADVWFISTPNGFNHFKDMAEKQDEDWSYHHYTTFDNPHIPKEEIEAARLEMDEDSFAQEMMGEFRKMSGLIYKEFTRETHMVDVPPLRDGEWSYTRSIDFGFGHKTALIYFAINSTGSEIYAYDGIYQSGLVIDDMADAIKIKDAGKLITNPVADSAQPMFLEQLDRLGVHFNPVKKGPDSVKNGITKVAELLKVRKDTGKPTLMFSNHLTWIADEFETYRWMENKTRGFIKEAPLKKDDDACFIAGTKVLTKDGEKNIEDVTRGDLIVTPFGLSPTTGSYKTGKKKVIDYGVFTSTPNHKVLTNRGIVRVDALRYNDRICQRQFAFKESLIDDILNQKTEHIEFIFNALLTRNLEAKQDFYTEKYGNTITVKYLVGWKYTILMVILLIMKYLTWSASLILSMLKGMIGVIGMGLRNIKKRLLKKQDNGEKITQKRHLSFIQRSLRTVGKKDVVNKLLKPVLSAKKNTKHTFLKEANTVIKIAKRQPLEEKEVYNLATNHGMYYANGVLVSNCDAIRYFAMNYIQKQTDTVDFAILRNRNIKNKWSLR